MCIPPQVRKYQPYIPGPTLQRYFCLHCHNHLQSYYQQDNSWTAPLSVAVEQQWLLFAQHYSCCSFWMEAVQKSQDYFWRYSFRFFDGLHFTPSTFIATPVSYFAMITLGGGGGGGGMLFHSVSIAKVWESDLEWHRSGLGKVAWVDGNYN